MPSPQSVEIRKTIVKSHLDPEVPIQEIRDDYENWAMEQSLPEGIEMHKETIAGVPCLWVQESGKDYGGSILFHVHGGGLILGTLTTSRIFAAQMAQALQVPILIPEYRLAPEFPYPCAMNDLVGVYQELTKNRFKAKQIVMSGDSSGGGLALSTLIQLREQNLELPRSTFFISGHFDLSVSGESIETRKDVDPFTSEEALIHCGKLYADGLDLKSPLISPLFADLSHLPPCLILVGDHEILLSDSIRLQTNIEKAGGKAELRVWESMWHVWMTHPTLPETSEAFETIKKFIR